MVGEELHLSEINIAMKDWDLLILGVGTREHCRREREFIEKYSGIEEIMKYVQESRVPIRMSDGI